MHFHSVVKNASLNVFQEFVHLCINALCRKKLPTYEHFKSATSWTEEEYNFITKNMMTLLQKVIIDQLPEDKILEEVPELDSAYQKALVECILVRKEEMQDIYMQALCGKSGPALQDFDWKVKWVMGSSKLTSLREPLLSLDLHVTNMKSVATLGHEKTVSLELDKEELKSLIKALETASNCQTQDIHSLR